MKTIDYNKAALKLELFTFESEMGRKAASLEKMKAITEEDSIELKLKIFSSAMSIAGKILHLERLKRKINAVNTQNLRSNSV